MESELSKSSPPSITKLEIYGGHNTNNIRSYNDNRLSKSASKIRPWKCENDKQTDSNDKMSRYGYHPTSTSVKKSKYEGSFYKRSKDTNELSLRKVFFWL